MRAFRIEVVHDILGPNANAFAHHVQDGLHVIHLPVNEKDSSIPGPMFGIFAHELGHVVASEYGLPGNRLDPRSRNFDAHASFFSNVGFMEGKFHSEQEAWRIADTIIGYERLKQDALRSYTPGMSKEFFTYIPKDKL